MKGIVVGFALLIIVTGGAWAAAEQTILARVTVYSAGEHQGRKARWTDAPLRNGHCAVDPHKIPYGSKVLLDGDELTAVDTGPAVVNRKAARAEGHTAEERSALVVDRYFESKEEAVAWAKSHPPFMQVRVIPPSSRNDVDQASLAGSEKVDDATPLFGWRAVAGLAALTALAFPFVRRARRRAV